jgi:hypothetical protein
LLRRKSVLQSKLPREYLRKQKRKLKQPGERFFWKPKKKRITFVPRLSKKAVHDEESFKEVKDGFFRKKKASIEKERLLNAKKKP